MHGEGVLQYGLEITGEVDTEGWKEYDEGGGKTIQDRALFDRGKEDNELGHELD